MLVNRKRKKIAFVLVNLIILFIAFYNKDIENSESILGAYFAIAMLSFPSSIINIFIFQNYSKELLVYLPENILALLYFITTFFIGYFQWFYFLPILILKIKKIEKNYF